MYANGVHLHLDHWILINYADGWILKKCGICYLSWARVAGSMEETDKQAVRLEKEVFS